MVSPQARREAVGVRMAERAMGVTHACGLIGISRSLFQYRRKRSDNVELTRRMVAIAGEKRRYGYRRIHVLLLREGWRINSKRRYRLYREARLSTVGACAA